MVIKGSDSIGSKFVILEQVDYFTYLGYMVSNINELAINYKWDTFINLAGTVTAMFKPKYP